MNVLPRHPTPRLRVGHAVVVARGLRGGIRALATLAATLVVPLGPSPSRAADPLTAGAAAVDVTPQRVPVEVNGGFTTRMVDRVTSPLVARAVVLRRGPETVAIVVVDSCMLPRELCDAIKRRVTEATGIPPERLLVAATHTHSAPSVMDFCLGAMRDEAYTAQLIPQVADAVARAHARLEPALVGCAAVDAWAFTHCRRWVKRSDRIATDPFGAATVRAMMHPRPLADYVGPSGPVDPAVTMLSVVRTDGRPIALVANFSMHYLGSAGVSADYFGRFAEMVERRTAEEHPGSGCVAMMTQGTSGDLMHHVYDPDAREGTPADYHERLAELVVAARRKIAHAADAPLGMDQTELTLSRRVPDAARLAWADRFEAARGDRPPNDLAEVYARQARWLHEHPSATLVLQAIRIGDLAITALPNEVFGITGLKLKRASPFGLTMNVSLANGAEGYIPPPEQHVLGGYTTWPASTAGLEVQAEPRIVEAVVGLLERVGGVPRRPWQEPRGPAAEAVLQLEPFAFWRLEEIERTPVADAAGDRDAAYEDGIAFHLPGVGPDPAADLATGVPARPSPFSGDQINRAAHFAGGRVAARLPGLPRDYTVSLWLWNGLPCDARPVTGYVFSRGRGDSQRGDHLGLGGTHEDHVGRLFVFNGEDVVAGRTALPLRRWHHVVLVRQGGRVRVHLDGAVEPELDAELAWTLDDGVADAFVGGRCDRFAGFEGRIDEVALFDRPLAAADIARLHAASGRPPAPPRAAASRRRLDAASPDRPAASDGEGSVQPPVSDQPALAPAESAARIAVPRGFRVALAAAEPLVLDPVAFDWDAAGRLWVVEMGDYPLGTDGRGAPGGRVRVLTDTDRDGAYDAATLFADGLNFPNGCLTWRDGVIVTAAPEILFLADTDGDGRADRREVLVRGLAQGNQQLRPNGLRWGLDNWVYVASGSPGGAQPGAIESVRGGTTIAIGTRDFRFRPDGGELEPESGPTQFGRNRDDWGRWFGTQNAKPLWHYLLAERYLARNPFVASPSVVHQVLPAGVAVHPALAPERRYHSFQQAGHYTSACGGMVHRDPELFGPDAPTAFVCEPFHNLVQRVALVEAGVSFTGEPVVADDRDFLTSTDRWFRPVMVRTGPDGALWVADMYRFMIEHPDWLPAAGREELLPRYRSGDDRGRIYRVMRADAAVELPPDLRPLDAAGLVRLLDSPNGFLRDKAQQMLLWRGGDEAVPALRAACRDPAHALACLHACCTLDGLGRLEPADLMPALAAAEGGLVENALRLAEPFLQGPAVDASLLAAVCRCGSHPAAKVRLQAALALGETDAAEAGAALGRLLVAADDPVIMAGVLTSAPRHIASLAAVVTSAPGPAVDRALEPLLGTALGLEHGPAVAGLLAAVAGPAGDRSTSTRLNAVLAALAAARTDLTAVETGKFGSAAATEARRLRGLLDATHAFATAGEGPPADRILAAEVASRSPDHRGLAIAALAAGLDATQPVEVQQRAIRALAQTGAEAVPGAFARFWPESSPAIRPTLLDAWLGREAWCLDLLDRVRAGELPPGQLDASARSRLLAHRSRPVASRAAEVFGAVVAGREPVVERYRPALALEADAARGRIVFQRACIGCHRLGDEGRAVGPDVRSFAMHPPDRLLRNILDPAGDIQPGFQAFVCGLDSGEQIYGIVTAETATSITLKSVDAVERTILRSRIEALRGVGASLMPEGLEAAITPQEMADLLAFLATLR